MGNDIVSTSNCISFTEDIISLTGDCISSMANVISYVQKHQPFYFTTQQLNYYHQK